MLASILYTIGSFLAKAACVVFVVAFYWYLFRELNRF